MAPVSCDALGRRTLAAATMALVTVVETRFTHEEDTFNRQLVWGDAEVPIRVVGRQASHET
jgi:hypothetical protein